MRDAQIIETRHRTCTLERVYMELVGGSRVATTRVGKSLTQNVNSWEEHRSIAGERLTWCM